MSECCIKFLYLSFHIGELLHPQVTPGRFVMGYKTYDPRSVCFVSPQWQIPTFQGGLSRFYINKCIILYCNTRSCHQKYILPQGQTSGNWQLDTVITVLRGAQSIIPIDHTTMAKMEAYKYKEV